MDRLSLIRWLFDESAGRYARDIAPVLAPLTADFVAYAAPRRRDRVLDVGTGTGLAARMLAPYVRFVAGVDISPRALAAARETPTTTDVHFVRADLNRLPFAAGCFSLVVSSFGLNTTDPENSLRALRRVIAPGGRLVLQEWGPAGAVDLQLEKLLDEHAAADPGPDMMALREGVDAHPARWREQLQDTDDFAEWLADLGFTVEDATENAPLTIRLASADQYLAFKLAWTYRFEEVRAMDDRGRAAFFAGARACLSNVAQPDGSFLWQPVVFRVTARQ
jgi:ubiquinone/menaquinone biosynthesis C-methylase UbiE